jgi:hypothetical protein
MKSLIILFATGLTLLVPGVKAQEPLFDARIDYPAGTNPTAVCAADLNNDGQVDLAVANGSANQMSILFGRGGGYQEPVSYLTDSRPISIFAADIDNDNDIDIMTANNYGDNVSVLKNRGDGTFQPAINFGTGDSPASLFVIDLNGDNYKDIAVANNMSGNVSILINRGNGIFNVARNYAAGTSLSSVFAADFDSDGDNDLVVANNIYYSGQINILINNGDGTFQAPVSYAAGDNPLSLFVADLDRDGDQDIALTNNNSYPGQVSLFLNNGDGTFPPRLYFSLGYYPRAISGGDFDADDDIDLAVTNGDNSANSICWLANDGNAGFTLSAEYALGSGSGSIVCTDLDADSDQDIAVAGSSTNYVSVLSNFGDGSFAASNDYRVQTEPRFIGSADFDNDGDRDLAVGYYSNSVISILLNNGDGTFGDTMNYASRYGTSSLCAADFDGDDCSDLAVGYSDYNSGHGVSIMINDCTGFMQRWMDYSLGYYPNSICSADLNNNGHLDLVMTWGDYDGGGVYILLNDGDGVFQGPVEYTSSHAFTSLCVADVDGDSGIDLIAGSSSYYSGGISLFINNGDGTFQPEIFYPTDQSLYSVCTSDLDGDDAPDIIAIERYYDTAQILIWANDGGGNFLDPVSVIIGPNTFSVVPADFDGDMDNDLAITISESGIGNIVILLNNGYFSFLRSLRYGVAAGPSTMDAADFSGDGAIDLAVTGSGMGRVSVLINRSEINGVADGGTANIPNDTQLSWNYPNPFNARTTIEYRLSGESVVTIDIYDIQGRKVKTFDEGMRSAGEHQVVWDANGQASGTYFCRIKAGDFTESRKMLLLK